MRVLGDGAVISGTVAASHGTLSEEQGGGQLLELGDGTMGLCVQVAARATPDSAADAPEATTDNTAMEQPDPMAFLTSLASTGAQCTTFMPKLRV